MSASRSWLLMFFLCLSACSDDKPNIILISIDTLRTDAVGCYGAKRDLTPNIDAFARQGVVFETAYAQAPWTLPSFASLFTATYPSVHGASGDFENRFKPVNKNLTTVAESLKDHGYKTSAIVNNIFLKDSFGLRRGFDDYSFFPGDIFKIRKAEEVTERARFWLKNNAKKNDPYFLFLHYFDPHFAYMPPGEFKKKYAGPLSANLKKIKDPVEVREGKITLSASDKEGLRNLYDGEVAYTDREIGKLLDYLRSAKLLEDAIVIITSDHGEEFWDHGEFEHGHSQYEELVKVPLILGFPGNKEEPRTISSPVKLMDLFPFLYDYLNLNQPQSFQGRSFLNLFQGKGGAPNETFLFETCLYGSEKKAIRAGRMKLVMDMETRAVQLFNLKEDPLETKDLALTHPEAVSQLKSYLLKMVKELENRAKGSGGSVNLPEEEIEMLRRLGYLK